MAEVKKESAIEQRRVDEELLREAFAKEQNNPDFVRVLKHLEKVCGFSMPDTVVNGQTGEVNLASTAVNAAMRGVYLKLRKYMPKELISKVEIE